MDKKNISGLSKPTPVEKKPKFSIKKHLKTIIIILIIIFIFAGGAFGIIKFINWQEEIEKEKIEKQSGTSEIKIDTETFEAIKDWEYHGTPIDLENEFSGRDNPFILY